MKFEVWGEEVVVAYFKDITPLTVRHKNLKTVKTDDIRKRHGRNKEFCFSSSEILLIA
jgi:hypothetical protein